MAGAAAVLLAAAALGGAATTGASRSAATGLAMTVPSASFLQPMNAPVYDTQLRYRRIFTFRDEAAEQPVAGRATEVAGDTASKVVIGIHSAVNEVDPDENQTAQFVWDAQLARGKLTFELSENGQAYPDRLRAVLNRGELYIRGRIMLSEVGDDAAPTSKQQPKIIPLSYPIVASSGRVGTAAVGTTWFCWVEEVEENYGIKKRLWVALLPDSDDSTNAGDVVIANTGCDPSMDCTNAAHCCRLLTEANTYVVIDNTAIGIVASTPLPAPLTAAPQTFRDMVCAARARARAAGLR